jgi:hypothetical protein
MTRKFSVKIELMLAPKGEARIVSKGRVSYRRRGPAIALKDGQEHLLSAREALPDTESALLELLENYILSLGAGTHILRLSCGVTPKRIALQGGVSAAENRPAGILIRRAG